MQLFTLTREAVYRTDTPYHSPFSCDIPQHVRLRHVSALSIRQPDVIATEDTTRSRTLRCVDSRLVAPSPPAVEVFAASEEQIWASRSTSLRSVDSTHTHLPAAPRSESVASPVGEVGNLPFSFLIET